LNHRPIYPPDACILFHLFRINLNLVGKTVDYSWLILYNGFILLVGTTSICISFLILESFMVNRVTRILGIIILLAVLGFFAWVTDAPAYLGHQPATCNNCHVMDAQYENW
jgi:hypothetical protein